LQVKSSALAGLRLVRAPVKRSRRSSSALTASRTWKRTVRPRRATSPMWNYSMATRPGNVFAFYAGARNWQAPAFNKMAQLADFLQARIGKNRPFTQVTPIAGDFMARIKARKLSRWLDQQYHDLKLWAELELAFLDAMYYGTGIIKIHEGLDGKIAKTRVYQGEFLVNEEEATYITPPALIHRVFAHRQELLDRYGRTDEAVSAIKSAPSVHPGFYFGAEALNTTDVVAFVEGYAAPRILIDGKTGEVKKQPRDGRHILAVGNYPISIEGWERPSTGAFAFLRFKQLSSGFFGQGLAEQLLTLQRELNRIKSARWESNRRLAWPRVLIEMASKVNPEQLADKAGGVVKYAGTPPQFVFPPFDSDSQERYEQNTIKQMSERAGVSDMAAQGSKQPGLSSGLAIEKFQVVEDARHADLGQRQEDFVTEVSELLVYEGERLRPDVKVPGRRVTEIKWKDIDLKRDSYFLRAFPMSSLPQTIGGKQQIISTWFANQQITRETKMRLEQTYDLANYEDLATASQDSIELALDDMLEHGKFVPPEPFFDTKLAVEMSQSRYLLEKIRETPRDRLDLILRYLAQLEDQAGQTQPENPAPPYGIAPPGAAPAALSPPQVSPEMGAPPVPPPQ
jgi:hypothetical protein